jgi:hypothetical protein
MDSGSITLPTYKVTGERPVFQLIDMNDQRGQNANDAFVENYPPRLRAMILFSSLIGSWLVVAAAAYLLVRCL